MYATNQESVLQPCEWLYSGQGFDYQVLAGPIYIVTNSVFCIVIGALGDKVRRNILLSIAVVVFSAAGLMTGMAKEYWHLVVLRMLVAAG
jgi:MFS family permease